MGWFDSAGNKVADDMLSNGEKTLNYITTGNTTYYARYVYSDEPSKTYDDRNIALWFTCMLLSIFALVGLFFRKKKEYRY